VFRYYWLFLLFIFTLVTDQLAKTAVDTLYVLHESRSILGSYLQLTYIRNSGAAFGISVGNPKIMIVVTVLVTLVIAFLFFKGTVRPAHALGKAAVVLVLGGATGNLIDRIRFGEVIDFIDMGIGYHRWPVYNLADIYVTVGMFILFFTYTSKTDTPVEPKHLSSD